MNAQMICQRGSTALQSQRVKPVTEQKCAIRSAAASRPRTLGSTIRMSIELDQNGPTAEGSVVSRRHAGQMMISSVGLAAASPLLTPLPALANPTNASEARANLLTVIKSGGGYEDVQAAIDQLVPYNPTANPARVPELQGEWRLIWSSATAEVTKATRDLPLPFQSIQLVGPGGGMEEGRAANLIRVLGGFVTLKLSSSALEDPTNSSAVTIGPPFRLELLVAGKSIPLQSVESTESPTTDILGNQLNEFTQLYLESTGQAGDIRISKVTSGDPAVVDSAFVHVRI